MHVQDARRELHRVQSAGSINDKCFRVQELHGKVGGVLELISPQGAQETRIVSHSTHRLSTMYHELVRIANGIPRACIKVYMTRMRIQASDPVMTIWVNSSDARLD